MSRPNLSKLTNTNVKISLGDPTALIDSFSKSPHLVDAGMNTAGETTQINLWEFARTQLLAVIVGEFFASWFVSFIICYVGALSFATTVPIAFNVVALSFGLGLAVFTGFALFGHISGGHANPMLSLLLFSMHVYHYIWEGGLWLIITRLILLIAMWIFQFAGWIVGAACVWYALEEPNTKLNPGLPVLLGGINGVDRDLSRGFFIEFIASTILYCAFAFSVVDRKRDGHLIMGLVTTAITLAVGAQTGASMNPFRWLATAIINNEYDRDWTVYIWPPFIAVLFAFLLVEFWRRFIEPVSINRDPAVMAAPDMPPRNKYVENRKENSPGQSIDITGEGAMSKVPQGQFARGKTR
jgi:glycerol uptake facilitator-like aquaporin